MICKNCGTKCVDTMKICVICGSPLGDEEEKPLFSETDFQKNDEYSFDNISNDNPADGKPVRLSKEHDTDYFNSGRSFDSIGQEERITGAYSTPRPENNSRMNGYRVSEPMQLTEETLPEAYKPLSTLAVFGYLCLFSFVPCAGFICALIMALSDTGSIARKRLAQGWLLFTTVSAAVFFVLYFGMIGGIIASIGGV